MFILGTLQSFLNLFNIILLSYFIGSQSDGHSLKYYLFIKRKTIKHGSSFYEKILGDTKSCLLVLVTITKFFVF